MSHPDSSLRRYVGGLTAIFRGERDKREAHRKSGGILGDMTTDPSVITAILRRHLEAPAALNAQHYPVVAMTIEENPFYTLVANCWIPLPDGASDVTTKAIHHHGTMLLTTATTFGPGYEHWKFTPPQVEDPEQELYTMRVIERGPHPLHHLDFVDAHVAHVPLFPRGLSITLALWSALHPTTWRDVVKRLPVFRGREAALRRLAARVGLTRALDLKTIEYFDFYPTDDGFKGMRERLEFERGPNTDYLQSVFHIVQATGNDRLAPLVGQHLEADRPLENRGLVTELLGHLRGGRPIPGCLSRGHHGIPHANFRRADIERALAAQTVRPPAVHPT